MNARLAGAATFAALGAVPPLLVALWGARSNPWFLDAPLAYAGIVVLPCAAVAAVLGLLLRRGSGRIALLVTVIDLAMLMAAAAAPKPQPVAAKLLVFGIDGASWDMLDTIDTPHLDALAARGTAAELTSREPMFSPLLWTTMATGKVPEEHGIHGFRTSSDQVRAARFWDVAWANGLDVGIYKWLVTWPPGPTMTGANITVDRPGFMVPAWLAGQPDTWPDDLRFVKELELSRRLKRKKVAAVRPGWKLALAGIPHGLRFSTLLRAARWQWIERFDKPKPEARAAELQVLRAWIDRDVFIHALRTHRPDVVTFTTYATDALGHTHFGYMADPAHPLRDALPAAYRQADAILGEALAAVSDDTAVLVVSDHGFRAMGAQDAGRYFAPKTDRLQARVSAEVAPAQVAKVGHKITITLSGDDWQADREALLAWLPTLVQASTGAPFYRWEDVPDSPSSVGLTLRDERIDQERLDTDKVGDEPLSAYAVLTEAYTGEHDAAGILVAVGPGVPGGQRIDPVPLLDLAPTILAMLGLPAADDMPGTIRFGDGDYSERLARVPTYDALAPKASPSSEADVNTEMLQQLGYVEE